MARERFTEKQIGGQREIYEQLRAQAMEAKDLGRADMRLGVENLKDLFGATGVELTDPGGLTMMDSSFGVSVPVEVFSPRRFSSARLRDIAERLAYMTNFPRR